MQGAVQAELDQFFANLRNRADSVRMVSAQAFCKARYKISALVFGDLNQKLMALVEEHLPVPRWQELRVVAGDGTAVRLTTMRDGVRSIVTGVAFGLYLPGMELFLHFALQEGACDERQMLFEAIERLRTDDLLVLDRGFPCRWLAAALTARGILSVSVAISLADSGWYASSCTRDKANSWYDCGRRMRMTRKTTNARRRRRRFAWCGW
ncbi:MAG: hypothetical protein IPJ27_09440 [Candidatus Accumulibacter sp.]|uniref:Transposase IS4-like domain-containing protein n=1 Tax=Candidatus Accumulibacter proximus TaxID=2954385 RepID=A0A935PYS4_9PROT|nr:hypothetical protein [Candidatus Accumulibacter proximus]